MSGEDTYKIYKNFTKPHPKYKLIKNKSFGVALLNIPRKFEEYLKGKEKELTRRKIRRAKGCGFYFDCFSPIKYIDEIISINISLPFRQGIPLHKSYQDSNHVKYSFQSIDEIYGVFDKNNTLKAYAYTPISGDVFIFSTLLGHGDDLINGIMYLLISEVIREMIERKIKLGAPQWAMYDTMLGASEGLRFFKERLGFKPYRVQWIWAP
jgi:hypothetical protein